MKQILCLFLIIFLFCTTNVFAARYYDPNEILALPTTSGPTFYVAKTGSDSNSGTSLEDAWLTMGKAMFAYKDRTSAGKGIRVIAYPGIYRERWSIPNSWTASTSESNRIYIVGSGTGETIFDSGMIADSWSVHYDSIYKSKITNPIDTGMPADLTAVVIDDDMYSYHPQDHLVDVEEEGDWYYDTGTGTLYLWVLLTKGDPSDDDVVIVEDHGDSSGRYAVTFKNKVDYATIQNVTIRGSAAFGTFDYQNNNHNNIKHCKIQWNAKGGILMSHASYNVCEKNLVQGNIIRNWPRGRWNSTCAHINAGGWPQSLGGPGNDHSTISGNIIRDGGGEGLGGSRGVGYAVVYDNIVYNNWSVGIYFDNNANNIIRNNYVYVDRVFTSADISNHCRAGNEANRVLRRCRQEGIGTANEVYSGWGAESSDNSIFNNVIVNCRVGITHYGEHVDSGLKNAKIYQNTIIVPDVDGSSISDFYRGFSFSGDVNDTGSTIYNNVVYSRNSNNILVKWKHAITAGIVWDYNIWYAPDNATPFRFDRTEYNFVDWKAKTSKSANGTNVDPDLQSLSSSQGTDNYRPNIGSVSLSGGKVLGPPYDTDFNYVSRQAGASWSRGAFGSVDSVYDFTAQNSTEGKLLQYDTAGKRGIRKSKEEVDSDETAIETVADKELHEIVKPVAEVHADVTVAETVAETVTDADAVTEAETDAETDAEFQPIDMSLSSPEIVWLPQEINLTKRYKGPFSVRIQIEGVEKLETSSFFPRLKYYIGTGSSYGYFDMINEGDGVWRFNIPDPGWYKYRSKHLHYQVKIYGKTGNIILKSSINFEFIDSFISD